VESCLESGSFEALAEDCAVAPPASWLRVLSVSGASGASLLRLSDAETGSAGLERVGLVARSMGVECVGVGGGVCGGRACGGWHGWIFVHDSEELVTVYALRGCAGTGARAGTFATVGWGLTTAWLPGT